MCAVSGHMPWAALCRRWPPPLPLRAPGGARPALLTPPNQSSTEMQLWYLLYFGALSFLFPYLNLFMSR